MKVVEVHDAGGWNTVSDHQLKFGNKSSLCSREGGHHDRPDSISHRIASKY